MPYSKAPSPKVLANRRAVVVLNRAAFTAAELGIADGLYDLGLTMVADASLGPIGAAAGVGSLRDPAAAAKRGSPMMLDTGWVGVWANGLNVAFDAPVGKKIKGLSLPFGQVVMVAAFASRLSHLHELGTIKMIARPFLTPAFNRNLPNAEKFVVPAMGKRIAEVPE